MFYAHLYQHISFNHSLIRILSDMDGRVEVGVDQLGRVGLQTNMTGSPGQEVPPRQEEI